MKLNFNLHNLSKAKIFLICNLFFIAGIAAEAYAPAGLTGLKMLWFTGMAAAAVALVFFWKTPLARLFCLAAVLFLFGLWRFAFGLPAIAPDHIAYYNDKSAVITGIVVNEPDRRENNQKLEIKTENISVGTGLDLSLRGKILVTTGLYPRYEYGDELRLECNLEAPEEFDGFAYNRYLARYDIYSVCYYPVITKLRSDQGNFFYAAIFRLKERLYETMDKGLNEPAASFARALILGDKKGMGPELKDSFARSGLSHLAAISGDCISIIAAMTMSALLGLGVPRRYAFYIASAFLLVYVVLIGLPASAMRAGLMGFLVLLAIHLGRLNKLLNALVFAAAIMLIFNPRLLRDDVGFQLSFLAVAGLAYVYPLLDRSLSRFRVFSRQPFKAVKEAFSLTLAAQVFTWPIIAYNFSQVSLVSPLANILVLWTLPFALAAGFSGLLLSLLIANWAFIFFLPAWFFLSYIVKIAEFTSGLPFSALKIDYIWSGWLWLYFILAGYILWRIRRMAREKMRLKI